MRRLQGGKELLEFVFIQGSGGHSRAPGLKSADKASAVGHKTVHRFCNGWVVVSAEENAIVLGPAGDVADAGNIRTRLAVGAARAGCGPWAAESGD